jgi:hypothetical protein
MRNMRGTSRSASGGRLAVWRVIDADYIVGVVGMMIEIGEIGGRGKGAIEVIEIVLIEEIGKVAGNTSKSFFPQHLISSHQETEADMQ